MTFTGKATYSAGATLPEHAEDVSDIISVVSPAETPLLAHLGNPHRAATSTVHEWLEDVLLPNSDVVDDAEIGDGATATSFNVANGSHFQIGDQILLRSKPEVMLVTGISNDELTVVRTYGGSTGATVADGDEILILGNAALEGADASPARFTNRTRRQNYTQIFTATVEVSGSQLAARQIGIADEMDYQMQERLRELMRDLENCVINGIAPAANAQGNATTRRTMRGIRASIETNIFQPGEDGMPDGDGDGDDLLNEALLNAALRAIWEQSAGRIDTIVCGGAQKRMINRFVATSQRFTQRDDRYRNMVNLYESDFGVCRIIMSRSVPQDSLLLLDSSRIDVLPLLGRSFHFKRLASAGDAEIGQLIGEYTLEFRNENAHGLLTGLAAGA